MTIVAGGSLPFSGCVLSLHAFSMGYRKLARRVRFVEAFRLVRRFDLNVAGSSGAAGVRACPIFNVLSGSGLRDDKLRELAGSMLFHSSEVAGPI